MRHSRYQGLSSEASTHSHPRAHVLRRALGNDAAGAADSRALQPPSAAGKRAAAARPAPSSGGGELAAGSKRSACALSPLAVRALLRSPLLAL